MDQELLRQAAWLGAGGLLAGTMNALAGGGSFVSLPVLIGAGVSPVAANASSTVALFPGGLASAWTYRDGLMPVVGVSRRALLAMTLAGGLAGSVLLLSTPAAAFDRMLPWLLLFATLALAFGRQLGTALRRRVRIGAATTLAAQFVLGVYGGYFGGAVGLLMTAVWGLLGGADPKALNAPRTLMVSAANSVAVVIFIAAGAVAWRQTVIMLAGATIGGYAGARLGRVLPARAVRLATLACTTAITLALFARAYR
jgi:uncharacterized membrane protein YfcA